MSAPRTALRSLVAILAALMVLAALPGTTVLAAASNDERANAIIVAPLPFVDAQDTSDATTAADDPDCFGNGPTVWYRFDTTETVDVIANTFGSDYDTTLSVYVDEGGDLLQLACNDDWEALQSQVGWTAQPGVTYWIMVGAYGSGFGGNLLFSMDEGVLPPPPEPVQVTLDILAATLHRSSNHVTVDVSVTCSEPGFGYIGVSVRQRAGRTYVDGYGFSFFECGTDATTTSVTTSYETGIFAGGSVDIVAFADVETGTGYGFGFAEATLRVQMSR
jgi:hypothetical protein